MSFRHGNCAIDPKGFHDLLTFWVPLVGAVREPPLQTPANRPCSFRPRKPPNQRVYVQLPCVSIQRRWPALTFEYEYRFAEYEAFGGI